MSKDEIIAQQAEQIAKLESQLSAALARIRDLEAQLKADSRTSSRPPSSDGLKNTTFRSAQPAGIQSLRV